MPDIIINERFKVIKKIGSGSFGTVYKGLDLLTNNTVAIKFENENSTKHTLEFKIFKKLENKTGFPEIIYEGKFEDKNILVMECLGPTLEDLFDFTNKKFGLKTVLMIALQILNRIETLHENGFIHRDIKPDNFLIGIGSNKNRMYMIDFGLSKEFLIDGKHIPIKSGKTFTGSFRYSSLRNHKGFEQSRRDDLESIGYMLIYFLRGNLPWQGLKGSTKSKRANAIFDVKKNIKLTDLCKDLPKEFMKYVKYCRELKYDEKPDYNYLRSLFVGLFKHHNYELDYVYDWNVVAKTKKEGKDETL